MSLVARDLATNGANRRVEAVAPVILPAQEAAPRAGGLYRHTLKRALDIIVVLVALPIWLPVILIGAALAASDGHTPFYRQKRVGRGGREFWLLKLRTMVMDADAKLEAHLAQNPDARAEWDLTQKLKNDPRITFFGRMLRKSSLDELPQLINVLKGDMSLVGPRPMMVKQRPLYDGKSYYTLRPGLTGLWQVSDRNACSFADRVRFDDTYAANLSFGQDVVIAIRTVGVVLRGTGY